MQLLCPICRHTLPIRTADVNGGVMVAASAYDTIAVTSRCRNCRNVVGFSARDLGWRFCESAGTGACAGSCDLFDRSSVYTEPEGSTSGK